MKVLGEFLANYTYFLFQFNYLFSISVQLSCSGPDSVVSGLQCVVGSMCTNSVDGG